MRSFSAILVVLYIAHIIPTCLGLLHCFVNSLGICSVMVTSELLMCVISSYVHDSLTSIGGESNSGSTRSCHWEAESSG